MYASAHGVPVNVLDRRSRATSDFEALAGEVRSIRLEDGRELEREREFEVPAERHIATPSATELPVELPDGPAGGPPDGPWSVGTPR